MGRDQIQGQICRGGVHGNDILLSCKLTYHFPKKRQLIEYVSLGTGTATC